MYSAEGSGLIINHQGFHFCVSSLGNNLEVFNSSSSQTFTRPFVSHLSVVFFCLLNSDDRKLYHSVPLIHTEVENSPDNLYFPPFLYMSIR